MKNIINQLKLWSKMILLLVGIGVLYSYAMFQGGFVSWFLFYSFTPFLLFSLFLAAYPIRYWKIDRVISGQIFEAGDRLTVQIKITRKIPYPLYFLIVEEKISNSIHHDNKKQMLFPLFKREMISTYELDNIPRGEHVLDEIKVSTADFFGFIRKEFTCNLQSSIMVYPRLQPINLLSLKNTLGDGALARGLDDRKESLVPTSIREYQPGDRLSWINWKMTANKNSPMTKEFDKTENEQIVICIDRFIKINPNSFEKIVDYTASLANELYNANIPVGLISVGKEQTIFPIKATSDWKNQMFYHLAIVKNDSPVTLAELFESKLAVLPPRSTIVFVTEHIQDDLIEMAKSLVSHQYKIVLIITSRDESSASYRNQLTNSSIVMKVLDDVFIKQATRGENR